MDASQEVWDWEVLPDNRTLSMNQDSKNLDGKDRNFVVVNCI